MEHVSATSTVRGCRLHDQIPAVKSSTVLSPVQRYLDELHAEFAGDTRGEVATYIPELGEGRPGLVRHLRRHRRRPRVRGRRRRPARSRSSRSRSRSCTGMALEDRGVDDVLGTGRRRADRRRVQLDRRRRASNRPFNPMVNAGAIVTTGLVAGDDRPTRRWKRIARRRSSLTPAAPSTSTTAVYRVRELRPATATAPSPTCMRNFGMLDGDVDEALDLYFRQCSLARRRVATSRVMAATLANGGMQPDHRRARHSPSGNVEQRAQRDADVRDVRLRGRVDVRGRAAGEERRVGRGHRGAAGPARASACSRRHSMAARQQRARASRSATGFAQDFALHPTALGRTPTDGGATALHRARRSLHDRAFPRGMRRYRGARR